MKKIFLLFILFCNLSSYSQDTVKIKQIDRLVNFINNSNFTSHTDSIVQDFPEMKLWMRTYLTAITDSNRLKKYTNKVIGKREEDGVVQPMTTSSSFYFDQDKLIKVEEFIIKNGKEDHVDWYYADEKPLYDTLHKEGSEERANFLLTLSKALIKPFRN